MKLRALAKSHFSINASATLVAGFIRFVKRTSVTVYGPRNFHAVIRTHRPFILAMWHGQFMMLADLNTDEFDVSAMVSRHGDGELIAATLERFNIKLIRGAGAGYRKKDRGGAYAFRSALTALKSGSIVAMTADVPTAQARQVGNGIILLARFSGRPIIPIAAATSRFIELDTWSKLTVNLPFSTLAFVAGEPLFVPAHADADTLEHMRLKLERSLEWTTTRAYTLAGAERHTAQSTIPGTAAHSSPRSEHWPPDQTL